MFYLGALGPRCFSAGIALPSAGLILLRLLKINWLTVFWKCPFRRVRRLGHFSKHTTLISREIAFIDISGTENTKILSFWPPSILCKFAASLFSVAQNCVSRATIFHLTFGLRDFSLAFELPSDICIFFIVGFASQLCFWQLLCNVRLERGQRWRRSWILLLSNSKKSYNYWVKTCARLILNKLTQVHSAVPMAVPKFKYWTGKLQRTSGELPTIDDFKIFFLCRLVGTGTVSRLFSRVVSS